MKKKLCGYPLSLIDCIKYFQNLLWICCFLQIFQPFLLLKFSLASERNMVSFCRMPFWLSGTHSMCFDFDSVRVSCAADRCVSRTNPSVRISCACACRVWLWAEWFSSPSWHAQYRRLSYVVFTVVSFLCSWWAALLCRVNFRFWATICHTVRSMLSDRCLSVSNVGVLWPNGWID